MPDQPLIVLMLEDHTHYVEGLRFELGAEVILEHATEVSEALRALETNTFDAALVDLSLPPTHTVQEGISFLEYVSNSDSLFFTDGGAHLQRPRRAHAAAASAFERIYHA